MRMQNSMWHWNMAQSSDRDFQLPPEWGVGNPIPPSSNITAEIAPEFHHWSNLQPAAAASIRAKSCSAFISLVIELFLSPWRPVCRRSTCFPAGLDSRPINTFARAFLGYGYVSGGSGPTTNATCRDLCNCETSAVSGPDKSRLFTDNFPCLATFFPAT